MNKKELLETAVTIVVSVITAVITTLLTMR